MIFISELTVNMSFTEVFTFRRLVKRLLTRLMKLSETGLIY